MKKSNFYYGQLVNESELETFQTDIDNAIKNNLLDISEPGLLVFSGVTQKSAGANMSVDVLAPILAKDSNGERISVGSLQNVDLSSITLPSSGNEKYISVYLLFDRLESDPRVDDYSVPLNYSLDEYFEILFLQGVQAPVGTAVRPTITSEKILLCDFLINSTTTQITTGMLLFDRIIYSSLSSNLRGFSSSKVEINLENQNSDPTNGKETFIESHRGPNLPSSAIRFLEGANPLVDPPKVQAKLFTNATTFTWQDIINSLEAAGWKKESGFIRQLTTTDRLLIGGLVPNASAKLDIQSTTEGILIPRMTQAQRDLIASPAISLLIFNTDVTQFEYWNGATWSSIGSGGGSGGELRIVEPVTLDSTDISNGYKDLIFTPSDPDNVIVHVVGVSIQYPGINPTDDFNVITNGISIKRVSWLGKQMASVIANGSKVIFEYAIGSPGLVPVNADNVSLDTTNFNNNLSSADDTVQKALNTLDNLVSSTNQAINIAVDNITPFSGILAGALEVQSALDILDSHTHSASEIDTSGFTGQLSGITDVQSALNFLDINSNEKKPITMFSEYATTSSSYDIKTRFFNSYKVNSIKNLVLIGVDQSQNNKTSYITILRNSFYGNFFPIILSGNSVSGKSTAQNFGFAFSLPIGETTIMTQTGGQYAIEKELQALLSGDMFGGNSSAQSITGYSSSSTTFATAVETQLAVSNPSNKVLVISMFSNGDGDTSAINDYSLAIDNTTQDTFQNDLSQTSFEGMGLAWLFSPGDVLTHNYQLKSKCNSGNLNLNAGIIAIEIPAALASTMSTNFSGGGQKRNTISVSANSRILSIANFVVNTTPNSNSSHVDCKFQLNDVDKTLPYRFCASTNGSGVLSDSIRIFPFISEILSAGSYNIDAEFTENGTGTLAQGRLITIELPS